MLNGVCIDLVHSERCLACASVGEDRAVALAAAVAYPF